MLDEVGNGTHDSNGQDAGSKNEVFAAYDELLQKLKSTGKSTVNTKQEEAIIEERQEIVETAAVQTSDELTQHLINLRHTLNTSLDDVEIKLNTEKKKFETLQQAIAIQSKELNDLYEIKPQADTLAALVMAYKEKSVTLEQDINQKRSQWQREQEVQEEARREYESQTQKTRQREEENYIYNRDLFRRKEQEEYDNQRRAAEMELQTRRTELEENYRTRESALAVRDNKVAKRELEYQQLEEEVRAFPERLQQVAADAERIVAEKLAIKFEYEAKLLHKDFDAERQLHRQAISSLESKIEHLVSLNYSFKPVGYNTETAPTEV
jgi:hypothetical protein